MVRRSKCPAKLKIISRTLPFVAQLLLKSGSLVQLLARRAENLVNFAQFLTCYTLPGTFGVQNPTHSDTLLENPNPLWH